MPPISEARSAEIIELLPRLRRFARARRQRVFVPQELGEQVADPSSAQAQFLPVQQAMERLPDEQREVIGLVLIEGLSYREAAAIIGAPVGTITSRLARGREALQNMLGGSEQEQP
jgi:RNA polymerase sigma-70 factor, ECF subfamily